MFLLQDVEDPKCTNLVVVFHSFIPIKACTFFAGSSLSGQVGVSFLILLRIF